MERWDRIVLDINATCTNLGPKCLQQLGMHALFASKKKSLSHGSTTNIIQLVAACASSPSSDGLEAHAGRQQTIIRLPEESVDITRFEWEFKDDIPIPVIDHSDPAPSELIDIIRCQCKAQGKICSSEVCGCYKERISCTSY